MKKKIIFVLLIVAVIIISGCAQQTPKSTDSNPSPTSSNPQQSKVYDPVQGKPWTYPDKGYKESSLERDFKTSVECDKPYTNKVELVFSKAKTDITLKGLPKVHEVSNWVKQILQKEATTNPCPKDQNTCNVWNKDPVKCETFTQNAPAGEGTASIKAVCSYNFKCQYTTSAIAEFRPSGNLFTKFTLEGDEIEYTGFFIGYGGGIHPSEGGAYMYYKPIPEGHQGDIDNEFIVTTSKGKTYRLFIASFVDVIGHLKNHGFQDQYGNIHKANIEVDKGDGFRTIFYHKGQMEIDGETFPVEYILSKFIPGPDYNKGGEWFKIGGEKKSTGPIAYPLKDGLKIEVNDQLKQGPFTSKDNLMPIFYIKKGDKLAFEIIFSFKNNGKVTIFDRDETDEFIAKEMELVAGAWQILRSSEKEEEIEEEPVQLGMSSDGNNLIASFRKDIKPLNLVTTSGKVGLDLIKEITFGGLTPGVIYRTSECTASTSDDIKDKLNKTYGFFDSAATLSTPPSIEVIPGYTKDSTSTASGLYSIFGVEYKINDKTEREVDCWSFLPEYFPSPLPPPK